MWTINWVEKKIRIALGYLQLNNYSTEDTFQKEDSELELVMS